MDNLVQVQALCDLYSTSDTFNGRKAGEEFECPWILAKQLKDMGKLKILKDVNAQQALSDGPQAPPVSSSQADPALPKPKPNTSKKDTTRGNARR